MGRQERRTAPDRDEDFGGTAAAEDSRRAQECNALTDEQDDKGQAALTFINAMARRERGPGRRRPEKRHDHFGIVAAPPPLSGGGSLLHYLE
jgi:hypothetical protein